MTPTLTRQLGEHGPNRMRCPLCASAMEREEWPAGRHVTGALVVWNCDACHLSVSEEQP